MNTNEAKEIIIAMVNIQNFFEELTAINKDNIQVDMLCKYWITCQKVVTNVIHNGQYIPYSLEAEAQAQVDSILEKLNIPKENAKEGY